ncbi:MAG: YihY/virulence factor BrkB family protein [Actinomycetota bacterium]
MPASEPKTGTIAKVLAPLVIVGGVVRGLKSGNSPVGTVRINQNGQVSPRPSAALEEPIPVQKESEPGADSPLKLSAAEWISTLKRTLKETKEDRITMAAAGLAFYWFLAVFPALIAAIGLLDLLHAGPSVITGVENIFKTILPGQAAKVLVGAITSASSQPQRTSLIATITGFSLALWSASSGMVAMQVGLNVAYDVPAERGFFRKRLYALILIGATTVFGGLAVGLIVFGKPLGAWIVGHLPAEVFVGQAWTALRWVIAIALLTGLIALFYYAGPNRDSPNWKWVTPGGVIAMIIWVGSSLGFSIYANGSGSYATTYGSFAGVVILIFWLYLTGLALLVGAELNAQLERQSASHAKDQAVSLDHEVKA